MDVGGGRPWRQEELPLSYEPDEGGSEEGVKKRTANIRYERKPDPAVFEFEESGSSPRPLGEEGSADRPTNARPGADREHPAERGSATQIERLFSEAKAETRAGRIEEAIRLYREIIAQNPAHVRARNNLGVLLDQIGDHEVALQHFNAAIELQPENSEILTNLGAALASQGRYDEAEAQLRRAARLDPGGVDVRANLGILYFRRGLYSQADLELKWVCEHDPKHGLAHFYRGEALNRMGRIDEALEMLERASHLHPDRPRVYYLMGILYDRKNLKQEAAIMYRKARELSGH